MKRLLIIRHGGIGDCIMSLPAIAELQRLYEYTEIWCPLNCVPLMRADSVKSIEASGIQFTETTSAVAALMKTFRRFDRVFTWYRDDALFALFSKAGLSIEYHPAVQDSERIHMCDYFMQCIGVETSTVFPVLRCSKLEPMGHIVFHAYSGSHVKNWPFENFIKLRHMLAPYHVEWIMGPTTYATDFTEDCVRFDNLYLLARWMTSARLFVGNDSGPSHMAASVGVPTVALFGPTNPNIWGPRGMSKVKYVTSPTVRMKDLSVNAVYDSVMEALQ